MNTDCPTNLVRFTTTLARRLGVSRRTINRWLKHPRAPKKVNGRWSVWAWLDFLQTEGLYGTRLLDRSWVAINVAGLINERLPERAALSGRGCFWSLAQALGVTSLICLLVMCGRRVSRSLR